MSKEISRRSSEAEPADTPPAPKDDAEDTEAGLPVDRGYAWVIVFCCLVCNILCLGTLRAMGILFVEFLVLFQMSAGETTLILAAQSGCTSVAALLTQTVALSLLSVRQTMILGGLCGGLGFILSYFATSLYHLLFTQSLLVGVSHAMIYGPSCVIVSQYFHKRRSLATALNALGGNLGSMSMPVFTQALLTLYGVRGTMLVLGATYFQVCVAAGLLRPFDQYRRRRRLRLRRVRLKQDQPADKVPLTVETGNGEDTASRPLSQHAPRSDQPSSADVPFRANNLELFITAEKGKDELVTERSSDNEQDENSDEGEQETAFIRTNEKNGTATTDSTAGDRRNLVGKSREKDNADHHHHKLNKTDPSSQTSLAASHDSKQESAEEDRRPAATKRKSRCSKLLDMFDFHMFKQLPFWVIVFSFTLSYLPATLYGTYLPAMAVDKGVTGQRSALLLTVFGGCGIFARLGFGWFADLNYIPRYALVALLTTMSCTAGLFTPLYTEFGHLVAFSVTYGVFGIVVFSIFPVVMVDLLGLRGMSKAFGFVQLFEGVFIAGAHPVIGLLRDITGNYHASYYFMSGAGLLCACILLLTPFAVRHEKRKLSRTGGDAAELADVKLPLKSESSLKKSSAQKS